MPCERMPPVIGCHNLLSFISVAFVRFHCRTAVFCLRCRSVFFMSCIFSDLD